MFKLLLNESAKPFWPHLALLLIIVFTVLIGVVSNSGAIGYLIGSMSAMALDSPCAVAALIIGFSSADYKRFLTIGLVIGVITSYFVSNQVEQYRSTMGLDPAPLSVALLRVVAIIMTAHIPNAIRVWISISNKKDNRLKEGISKNVQSHR